MGIERIEQLEDIVKVHINFSNQSPIPDEGQISEISYSAIPKLPIAPEVPNREDDNYYWAEQVFIPKADQTLEYHFYSWQETASSRMQGLEGGPYLANPGKK